MRRRPSSSNLVALRRSGRASVAVNGQKRLLSGVHAVLHPQSERQLSGWTAYREVTPAPCAYAFTGSDATDTALALQEQAEHLNQMLRGHYAYYGIAGNIRALRKVHRAVECYWRKMLSSQSWKGRVWWKQFQQIKERFPLLRPKLHLPYGALQALATPL